MTTINSQEDFLRALSENPEWKAAVRAQILGEELLQLPARFDAFISRMDAFIAEQKEINAWQKQFNERAEARMDRMEDDISAIKASQQRTEVRMDRMEDDILAVKAGQARIEIRLDRRENDIATVKAAHARITGRASAETIPMDMGLASAETIPMDMGLEYVRTLSEADLTRMARTANPGLPINEIRSFRSADLVIEAASETGAIYIAAEISYTADLWDSTRAQRNARLLTEFTGHRAIAAVASVRNVNEVSELIDAGSVYWHQIPERYLETE